MRILSFFVVSLCWNIFYSFLHRKEMLIYFKICCDHIKYRLLKQKKETKQLRKNNCCWYIETKLVIFFSAVYIYLLTLKMSVLRRNNNVFFAGLGEIAGLDLLLAFLREIDRQWLLVAILSTIQNPGATGMALPSQLTLLWEGKGEPTA